MSDPYEYLKEMAKAGIAHTVPLKPSPYKSPSWSIVGDALDAKRIGCVSVILPRWLSMAFLWWKLPTSAMRSYRALIKAGALRRNGNET